jgi:hypothetical protein
MKIFRKVTLVDEKVGITYFAVVISASLVSRSNTLLTDWVKVGTGVLEEWWLSWHLLASSALYIMLKFGK